ncbi:MAG: hypothetical protein MI749_12325 [Desulfovibrionales bacterium]|nr:hypothetical protein [Desulfovibrionales bacterium]
MKKLFAALLTVLLMTSASFAEELIETKTTAQIFEQGFIQITGESDSGQSRYKAKRAATIIAQRNLLEAVQGIELAGATTVNDGMLTSDTISSSIKGFLRGGVVVKEEFDKTEGYARVTMRLNLHGANSLYELLSPVLQDTENNIASAQPAFVPQAPVAEKETTAAPLEKEYDGLIILVSGTSFRPALINRILTEKLDILYDPAKIAASMLIERGCGGYTSSEAKAKAKLKTWGCSNPLVVKCSKVQKRTEVIISTKDAETIFSQNQKNNFFSQAKVVFVL